MGQCYPHPTRWYKTIVAIIHIYGARTIFLLFYDNQNTDSESRDIEVGVSGPIFTQKISKALWENNKHTTQDGSEMLW